MEQVISRDGTFIGFMRGGAGPPMLFVHGTMADHRSWLRFSEHIKEHFTVYAMDRRGRVSSGDSPDYDLMREVEDVVAVLEMIGEPALLFGHSFGGLICLESALVVDRISRLILYEPKILGETSTVSEDVLEQIQVLIDRGENEDAILLFMRKVAKIAEDELEIYRSTPLWEPRLSLAPTLPREMKIDSTYHFDPNRFKQMDTPALLLVGGSSPEVYQEEIQTLHHALPDSQIVVLPGQQHIAHHIHPELLAQVLLEHVSH
jgi:pimeloyl-ACP methyl ester carboxylesterase